MKNVYIYIRITLFIFAICIIVDFIDNRKFALNATQLFTSVMIACLLGAVFSFIFGSKKYIVDSECMDLDTLKNKLADFGFKSENNDAEKLYFKGNFAYTFYAGNIEVEIKENTMILYGSRYVLEKILKK